MHLFRFHFLDKAHRVTFCHSVRLATDGAAVTAAHRMLVKRNQDCTLEIWQRNRLVHTENQPVIGPH